ncbi:MAG: hypothetical protein ABL977_14840, partial [Candidatus Eisenbacteria bacterium]
MSSTPPDRLPGRPIALASASIAVAVTALVCLPSAPGLAGLAGLLLVLATLLAAGFGLMVLAP